MKILNENVSRNILNKLKLNEGADAINIVLNVLHDNQEKYGITKIGGDNKNISIDTNNGKYWFTLAGDKIKISMAKDSNQPVVRTAKGKVSIPRHTWEVDGLLKDPASATIKALDTLEPAPKNEFIVALGDEYLGGFDENDQVFTVGDKYSAQRYSTREEAENIASQFENGEVEEI